MFRKNKVTIRVLLILLRTTIRIIPPKENDILPNYHPRGKGESQILNANIQIGRT